MVCLITTKHIHNQACVFLLNIQENKVANYLSGLRHMDSMASKDYRQ